MVLIKLFDKAGSMENARRSWLYGIGGWAVLAAALGCSKGPSLPTVPATGTVTLDGLPLADASVAFAPKDPEGKPANGVTDAAGKFQLKTFLGGTAGQVDGAMPGEYVVMVSKYEASSGAAPEGGSIDYNQQQQALEEARTTGKPPATPLQGEAKLTTPSKYGNAKDTDLNATVKPSGNQPFTFDLKSS
jgi:hypothetical protein